MFYETQPFVFAAWWVQVSLEAAGNAILSDDAASKDLNDYFSNAGMSPKAAARKSDAEARESIDAFAMSLNSEASLGKRFCAKHPRRCGEAAAAAAVANAKMDQHQEAEKVAMAKLLSSGWAPSAPTAAPAKSPGRDSRLGDDVMDIGFTKAADDGDVHVDGESVKQYMLSKDGVASNAWLKADAQVLKPTHVSALKLNVKAKLAVRRLPTLSAADNAALDKCNVPPPRPAYCTLLLDIGMEADSVKASMPTRSETDYRYAHNNGGQTVPVHSLVPIRMKHKDGADLGGNIVQFGIPDILTSAEEQHEEGNLVPSPYGKEKGGPLNPLLREGATRTQNPHWETEGTHYASYHAKIKSLDRATSDQVLYGAIGDYKKLGLALSDDFVSPTADAEAREKEIGVQPKYFSERFHPLGKFASNKDWKAEVDPKGFATEDADALVKAEGNSFDEFGGRSAVEQHLLYGQDFFNLGHAVDEATDNGGILNDVRYMGPGDGHPMPAFPRDTNAALLHPWTDQGHVLYDEVGLPNGGIVDTGRSNYTV